ncbi:alpha/beta hydrolase [Kitasatospora phosalacinea]|uniref:Alpha/beta hydrolase n=1 Tax=Kitasatospora phosalacinea TaxID=2065 RepID=A0ABW6GNY9_9ACTN
MTATSRDPLAAHPSAGQYSAPHPSAERLLHERLLREHPLREHPLREHLRDLDCLDETLAFNRAFERAASSRPARRGPLDPAVLALLRRNRLGGDTPPRRLPQARDRRLPGGVRVRVLDPGAPEGVLLHLHGGGWAFGSADGQDERLWELARRARLAVVSVDYRLAPEHPHPAGPEDCEAAARWLAEAEFGTRRLLIGGESAGAHLAVLTLLRLRDGGGPVHAYRAAHLAFGPYDLAMTPSQRDFGDRSLLSNTRSLEASYAMYSPGTGPGERRDPALSPLYADLTGLPPARLVVGTEDPLLDDSVLLARRWQDAGGTARLDVVAGAMHGFTLYPLTVTTRERRRESAFLAAAGR